MPDKALKRSRTEIVEVNSENVSECGFFCVKDPKHPGYEKKLAWLQKRFKDGLKIKLIFPPKEKKAAGFVEYIPGKHAWRPVDARGHMLIHCIFVEKRKHKGKGYASELIQDCIEDARKQKMKGVAVVASEGTWMASPDLFLKNGFELADEAPPSFKLLVRRFGKSPFPKFRGDWQKRLARHKGLIIAYTHQCPFSAKFLNDIQDFAEGEGLSLRQKELTTTKEAQDAVCAYGTFSLIHDGEVAADHPISRSRFRNIVRKELKLV